jgi:hypothetical protein
LPLLRSGSSEALINQKTPREKEMSGDSSVFVVLEDVMHGLHCVSVHRTRPTVKSAKAVHKVTVLGSQNDPEVVYIAQTYDRSNDIYNFAGLYGNYDEARSASGAKGSPRPTKIEA